METRAAKNKVNANIGRIRKIKRMLNECSDAVVQDAETYVRGLHTGYTSAMKRLESKEN